VNTASPTCSSLHKERSCLSPASGQESRANDHLPPVPAGTRRERGFSLIEILVTIGLLAFIVLGLLAMFHQTQRAFRSSITQTDLLEGARSTMDILTREIEQMTPSRHPDILDNGILRRSTNFFVQSSPGFAAPWQQNLPGTAMVRTNIVQQFFFLTKLNQDWIGTGYLVLPDDANNPMVGTLYRFTATNYSRTGPITVSSAFLNANPLQFYKIADGVVHLRAVPYAPNGFPVVSDGLTRLAFYRQDAWATNYVTPPQVNTFPDVIFPERWSGCYFVNDAVPAAVEIELGVLEPQVLQRYRSIPAGLPAARQYLADHAAQVHIFRQRISVRNVDISAYP
jgi:prepilin-type N-terminal cleavage/methylation domain-containing protein